MSFNETVKINFLQGSAAAWSTSSVYIYIVHLVLFLHFQETTTTTNQKNVYLLEIPIILVNEKSFC